MLKISYCKFIQAKSVVLKVGSGGISIAIGVTFRVQQTLLTAA